MNLATEISHVLSTNTTPAQKVGLIMNLFDEYSRESKALKWRFAQIVDELKKDFSLSYTEKDMDRHGIAKFNEGYDQATAEMEAENTNWHRRGYSEGVAKGDAEGWERGYDKGYEDAKKDIPKLQQQELDEHYNTGYQKGHEVGNSYGYDNGRADGYDAGHIDGFNKGYLKGREIEHIDALKESTKEYQRGVADGKKQIVDYINKLNKG